MNISIFGMGYVGCVTAACLAENGHNVIGVDINPDKVDLINAGKPTVIEDKLDRLVSNAVDAGLLRATSSAETAVQQTEISLICVGTPSEKNGSLDTKFVEEVTSQIGKALSNTEKPHLIVLRSTVLPGTTDRIVRPLLEQHAGRKVDTDLGLAYNPEFLREGSSVEDFYHPPKTVIGAREIENAKTVAELYQNLECPLHLTSIPVAEMVKYADNSFHALKVSFANEIGTIAKNLGIDGHEVMDIFSSDRKLNISTAYLRPGYAFGGSCLPKDVRALIYLAHTLDLEIPLLDAVLPSNQAHWQRGLDLILMHEIQPVGILGFSFKAGTDDLRESPILHLVERLIGKGYPVRIYDSEVNIARVVGSNRIYLENTIPHIAQLLSDDIFEVIQFGDIIVIGNSDSEFADALEEIDDEKLIIDLVRIYKDLPTYDGYKGIAW